MFVDTKAAGVAVKPKRKRVPMKAIEMGSEMYLSSALKRKIRALWPTVPVIPHIDAAIVAAIQSGGRLHMRSWHGRSNNWCGTTHCRAGWAIALAGDPGRELELAVGPSIAGAMIYLASRPGQLAPNFFMLNNHWAMRDLRDAAERDPLV
jgi:hypothetical protein